MPSRFRDQVTGSTASHTGRIQALTVVMVGSLNTFCAVLKGRLDRRLYANIRLVDCHRLATLVMVGRLECLVQLFTRFLV